MFRAHLNGRSPRVWSVLFKVEVQRVDRQKTFILPHLLTQTMTLLRTVAVTSFIT